MTEQELIAQARLDWLNDDTILPIKDLKDALEANYYNGNYDDIGGDVEAPTGHYYRIERWIVVTDSQGSRTVHTFDTIEEAEEKVEELENEYCTWDDV